MQTHAVMGSRAWSKSQSQLWANWQLQGPWQLVYTPVAAGPHQGLVAVEACDGNWTKGVQLYRWRGYLPVNAVILATKCRQTGPDPGLQAAAGTWLSACSSMMAQSPYPPPRVWGLQWRLVTGVRLAACKCTAGRSLLPTHTAVGISCRGLDWHLSVMQPHRPGLAASTVLRLQQGQGVGSSKGLRCWCQ